jgi:type I restriction enzyme, S subunit
LSEIWGKKGAIGLVPTEGDGALCTSHFFLFDVNRDKLEPRYLQGIFTANYLEDQLNAEAKGTTGYAAVRPKHLLSACIPLPPLPEQRRIVARIEELAARIEEARGLRRRAVEEAEALWAADAHELFADSNGREMPLRELVTVRGGGTPSKKDPTLWGGEIPWVSPKDMKSREIERSIDYITKRATQESSAKLVDPGAVLVVVRGMILAHTVPSAILRVPATINQDMKALVPNASVLPEYLCNAFWAQNRQILALVEKSSHDTRKLQTPALLNFRLRTPSLSEQRRIVAYLSDLRAKIDSLK